MEVVVSIGNHFLVSRKLCTDSYGDFIDLHSRDTAAVVTVVCRRHVTFDAAQIKVVGLAMLSTGVKLSVLPSLFGRLHQWKKLAVQPYRKFL